MSDLFSEARDLNFFIHVIVNSIVFPEAVYI